jgi:uncharacterized membrane protein YfcA
VSILDQLLHPDILALLAFGASVAGFVDTIAGGGGLITVPLLLLTGLPPLDALATNKLQGCFGTLAATVTMLKRKQVTAAEAKPGFAAAFLGGVLGAIAVHMVHPTALDVLIPIILGAIALYFLFAPRAGAMAGRPLLSEWRYRLCVIPAIGFYDGFFGPGAGSFYAATAVAWRGKPLLAATALAKILNFGSNLGAFILFLLAGKVVWIAGTVMICGQVIGAYLGSLAMISVGARLIRPMIVTMCFIMIARYLWQKGLLAGLF